MPREFIDEKTKCCGCTACASVCPKDCIEMKPDFEGFLYPVIDENRCIGCGRCHKVCPVENPVPVNEGERNSYVLRSGNEDIVMKSTSGGFFTPLADHILGQSGIICAAAFDDEFKVVHTFLSKGDITGGKSEIYARFRGSKYVQSHMGSCFNKIKELLNDGEFVCFIGTPCQVSGLKSLLNGKFEDRLLTVDVVCHGTPSPKLWDKYLKMQISRYKSPVKQIYFRNKTYGYHSATMKIVFENGKEYYGSARVDCMLKSFFKEISSRPICYECPFKGIERCSDLTLYDCWHISELVPGMTDDDKGYTNVIAQSDKGREIISKLSKDLEIYECETKEAVRLDGIMVENSAVPHKRRKDFYNSLEEDELFDHIQRFIPITKKDLIVERSKKLVYRAGLLGVLKKIFK